MRCRLVACAVCIAALTAAGCGEREIDVAKSANLIEKAVEEQVGSEVKAIKCPDEVKVKAQSSFTCTVTAPDGTTGIATATQTDGKGTIGVAAPFLPKGEAEQRIQTDLRTRSPRATVVCPDIIVVKPGGRFVCQANLGEINATITARQTNAAGSFTYTATTH